ncbi:MAG TPA: amidohydrolase family protein, partial [Acidimicrobiia bacterium]|nr:amidohydrolase family protein [Acidimicrobiia bacterium]
PFAPRDDGNEDPLTTMMVPTDADTPAMQQQSPNRLTLTTRAPLWQLVFGGVFDRHPQLRVAFTEVRADWVPETLAVLDRAARAHRDDEQLATLALTPSEYFRRNVVVTPSSIHRAEVEMRHDIGIDQLLFGADYPHWEGTWPNTRDWIRTAFDGVPIDEVRQILGGNAIRAYGLDEPSLREVAARIGPSPALLDEGPADDELVHHFHQRSGYSRPADPVDVDTLAEVVEEDLATLTR